MFILDKPYVSEFLKQSVIRLGLPVLENAMARETFSCNGKSLCPLVPEDEFIALCEKAGTPRIYANSENAGDWIAEHLGFTNLGRSIEVFKDKAAFRELIRDMYPDYAFRAVSLRDLDKVDPATMPKPFIIKPAKGFFSLGVHRVDRDQDWPGIAAAVRKEAEAVGDMYPRQVLDMERYVLEQAIEGEEFAVDAFYTDEGRPVITNILGHLFASEHDMSDRVYITSPELIEARLEPFTEFLDQVGQRAGLKNFPVHAELRVDDQGRIAPIEVNPMRFAGWCVADMTRHAWDFDPYEYYLTGKRPDWSTILERKKGNICGVVVADIAPDVDRTRIASVDYQAFSARFPGLLELRPVDYKAYSVFAFAFVETPQGEMEELKAMLGADLTEFLRMV